MQYTEVICKTQQLLTCPLHPCTVAALPWEILIFVFLDHFGECVPSKKLFKSLKSNQWKIFTVAYYHDVELNAGARDASSTCAITVTWLIEQRFNVPLDTILVISGTIFTGQMTQPTASKNWRKPVGHWDRLQYHQNHSTVLQYELG